MAGRRTGITKETPQNLLVDAPVILINGTPIGAARDGASFVVEQTIREPNIDGARGPIAGTRRVERVAPRITFQPLEWTPANWRKFLVGAQGSPVRRSTYVIGQNFHIKEVAMAGRRQDGKEVTCIVYNAIADSEEVNAAMEDESEAAPEIRMTGHFDPENTDGTEPWEVKFPS